MLAALLGDEQGALFEIDLIDVDRGDLAAAHPGLDQGIDDRPVAPGAVAFSAGAFIGEVFLLGPAAVFTAAPDHGQVVGGVEQFAALGFGERAFEFEDAPDGEALEFIGRVTQGEGSEACGSTC